MAFSMRTPATKPLRAIFMSTYVPRECGIATFTEDVVQAVSGQGVSCHVVAMNRPAQSLNYDRRVMLSVREDRLQDYLDAASFINSSGYDVLSVQHEFGIFGGVESDHLAVFLEAVEIPIITTLHTVLRKPSPEMRRNLRAVAERADAVVVMNSLAIEVLDEVYGIDPKKVNVVHHGAPPVARGRQYTSKADLNLQGLQVISTFGLLSSGKGLEYAVQAMPRIVEEHPDAVYLILGQTHPVVKQQEGEKYRESLKALAADLGMEKHVRFVDKYFTKAELITYLLATDIYLTPYLDMEQVTSGTLAYAMACGRPLVSTPYLYAKFLLGEDRGLLVPSRDPAGIAEACVRVLSEQDLKSSMERSNWDYGQTMVWPRVGEDYVRLFRRVGGARVTPSGSLRSRV